jgi:hypothetical protein
VSTCQCQCERWVRDGLVLKCSNGVVVAITVKMPNADALRVLA